MIQNIRERPKFKGEFFIEVRDKSGKLKHRELLRNGIVDVGMNTLLTDFFSNTAPPTNWYIGLITNTGFTALANSDTMASHAGWSESVNYSQATRPAWGTAAASGRAVTNASPALFSINASDSIYGIFVTTSSTKGGTSGTLWATAALAAVLNVNNGDSVNITYTVSG